jgi:hypothetical protein
MVVEVLAGSFNAVLESLAAKRVELIRGCVPRALGSAHAPVLGSHQMRHGDVVTATEALAIGAPHGFRDVGTAILIAIVDVGTAMIAEILSCAFDAVVKASALNVVPRIGWAIPVFTILCES